MGDADACGEGFSSRPFGPDPGDARIGRGGATRLLIVKLVVKLWGARGLLWMRRGPGVGVEGKSVALGLLHSPGVGFRV